jgi:hypothetical protein
VVVDAASDECALPPLSCKNAKRMVGNGAPALIARALADGDR